MSTLAHVNPMSLPIPATGRGAWRSEGIDFGYRYAIEPAGSKRIGTIVEKGQAYWAVAAGARAIQKRLQKLGMLGPLAASDYGCWGPITDRAMRQFQAANKDPRNGVQLTVDGICGMSDSRALWTPLIDEAEAEYDIPWHLLRGQIFFESGGLDPGAVGYYIYYPSDTGGKRFGGIDRALAQINSQANAGVTWDQAFAPTYAIPWTARNMRACFDVFNAQYSKIAKNVLWDAAVCWHNSHVNGNNWAKMGGPPSYLAAKYVAAVKNAIY